MVQLLHWSPSLPSRTKLTLPQSQLFSSSLYLISTAFVISGRKQGGVVTSNFSKSSPPLLQDASNDLQSVPIPLSISDFEITNEFIQGICNNPQTEALAFQYYQQAKTSPSFRPDKTTLRILFGSLIKSKRWNSISVLIDDLGSLHVHPDESTCARLVRSCIRARKLKLVESLLRVLESDKANASSAVSAFSSAMRSYNQLHMYRCTVSVFNQMIAVGLSPDSSCYRSILRSYQELGETEKVVALFLEYQSKKSGTLTVDAAEIYLILCESLGKSGRAFEALRYFREMEAKGMPPNVAMYASLMSSFAGIREAEIAEDLFREATKKGLVRDKAVFMNLVLMYVDLGQLEKTLVVVQNMRDLKIHVSDCILSTIINGFATKKGSRSAVAAYEQLLSLGCDPGQVTYASIINIYCRLGLSKMAEAAFSKMIEKGYDKCVVAYSNMISMYGKLGKVREAMRLLTRMKVKGCKPNVWVYNSLLHIHGKLMNLRQVEKLWKEMIRRKIAPDKISYTSIIGAYSKAKRLDECVKFFAEFKREGGKVDRALAGIMVGVFSKGSMLDELINLLKEIKEEGIVMDERLHESALYALRDAGLQIHVKWFQQSFGFKYDKSFQ
ncbi:pentatricopeptide repeat-containing protein At5g13770, chloroplastic-like [Zingiber officinale]|uniref:Pentatricopeptide repeat-containing protein n=1 Tax=Zingiber officinale TaxID=94328 RepID=A0A8J5KCG5_ZINOF|nr:pentatricopeptide repeat-containing protein At5g13770, chloroplastic-like [Zingiber officinale]KAG6477762.1 hypothetical protein ZIOFF_061193 [Zingiber officinale]